MKSTDTYLVLGIVFTVIGLSGQNAFLAIGLAFLAVGATARLRNRNKA